MGLGKFAIRQKFVLTASTISCYSPHSIPPKNLRKPEISCFYGLYKAISGMKIWVKI